MKRFASWLLKNSCSLISCELFSFLVLISTAYAGGFDEQKPPTPEPIPAPFTEFIPLEATNKTSDLNVVPSILNWDKWGPTYWLNQNICREMNVNFICFSAQTARQMRWQIPPKN